ncbi:unnamed protein product [Linum tenue]|uniref:HIT domain-containing protein n=1 Tax=Linum tenue TaxID=586396 RepID=A0AAV0RLW2_9ROSI|nr:unnamed protein product [Linum tenue]
MESRIRLAILCSHFLPSSASPIASFHPQTQFVSPCNSSSSSSSAANFIASSGGGKQGTQDCVFCSIVRGQSPAFKLNPLSHGHSLIIPKVHFSTLESTPPSLVAAMCSKAPFIANALMKGHWLCMLVISLEFAKVFRSFRPGSFPSCFVHQRTVDGRFRGLQASGIYAISILSLTLED